MSDTNKTSAAVIKRDDYKAIRKMDRVQLSEYLSRVWKRGYAEGIKAYVKRKPMNGGTTNEN